MTVSSWLLLIRLHFFLIITFIIKQNHLLRAVCMSLKMNGWEGIHHLLLSKMLRHSLLFFTFLTFLLVVTTIRSQLFLLLWSHCIITISFCFFHITIGRQMRIGQWQFLGRTANRLWITALVVLCCACIWLIVLAAPRSITCTCSGPEWVQIPLYTLHPCWYPATSTNMSWA